jgi:branched-chain amino acid transport system substrate-binding protein
VGRVLAVADWLPNEQGDASALFYQAFKKRFPEPSDDYVHMRMQLMIEVLAKAMTAAGTSNPTEVARAMEGVPLEMFGQNTFMRAQDHQFQQSLVVGVMGQQGEAGIAFDIEGSGYGFRVVKQLSARQAMQGSECRMRRY